MVGQNKGNKKSAKKMTLPKEGVKKAVVKPSVPAPGWYFASGEEITVAEIKAGLEAAGMMDIEIWRELAVLEVVLNEKASMDIEELELIQEDDLLDDFVAKKGGKALFYISFPAEVWEQSEVLLKALTQNPGGVVFGDTEDLNPVYGG